MKNKGLAMNFLFLPVSWNQPESSLSASAGFSVGNNIRQGLHLMVLAVVLFLSFPAPLFCAAESGALLENITFDRQSSSRETIAFKLNGPHLPKIFAMKGEAPKVVFDFYDTRQSRSIKGLIKSRGNLVSAIRTGMHTDPQLKTRVVLDLVPAVDYDFAQEFREEDNTLIITIFHDRQNNTVKQQGVQAGGKVKKEVASVRQVQKKKVEPPPAVSPVVAVKKPSVLSSSQLLINNISFEKSPEQGEKVIFDLINFHAPVVFGIEKGTPSIVCDFMDAGVGDTVPEIISANGEFVRQIRVEKDEKLRKTRVVLELVPNRHYDLQQIFYKEENLYVLFVKSSDSAGKGSSEKP
jgi:hypothetical protein